MLTFNKIFCKISRLDKFDLKTNGKYLSQLKVFYLSSNPIQELSTLAFDGLYLLKELKLNKMYELKKIQVFINFYYK